MIPFDNWTLFDATVLTVSGLAAGFAVEFVAKKQGGIVCVSV